MLLYHEVIEHNASRHPHKCAVALDAVHYSYGMLQARTTQIARLLVASGVQPVSYTHLTLPTSDLV